MSTEQSLAVIITKQTWLEKELTKNGICVSRYELEKGIMTITFAHYSNVSRSPGDNITSISINFKTEREGQSAGTSMDLTGEGFNNLSEQQKAVIAGCGVVVSSAINAFGINETGVLSPEGLKESFDRGVIGYLISSSMSNNGTLQFNHSELDS